MAKADTLLTAPEICKIYHISRATFERWVSLKLVPAPAERHQRKQGGRETRYWTSAQLADLAPVWRDFAAGLSTSELLHKYRSDTNRRRT